MRTPRRSRFSVRTAAGATAAGAALLLSGCAVAKDSGSNPVPGRDSSVYSGTASTDYHPVLDAFKDQMHLGACSGKNPTGVVSMVTASLVDVSASALAGNAECGKQITISNGSGSTVTATVVGECASCGAGDLDVSPALYLKLATSAEHAGAIDVTWEFSS